jgi:hypothetical protein
MMETLHPTSGFTSEASLPSAARPHTPPYTPRHHYRPNKGKRRLERSDSPPSSIHPTETSSPAKKAAKRVARDSVKVEELTEGDVGYHTDLDVVYPEELEEVDSSDGDDELSSTDGDKSDTGALTRRLSRMRCGDENAETNFEKGRRLRRMSKRMGSRVFKRSHSESIKGDSEVTDLDAMNDHDRAASQRRLRRRVRGPTDGIALEDIPRSSPEVGSGSAWSGAKRSVEPATPEPERISMTVAMDSDAMEVDEDDD